MGTLRSEVNVRGFSSKAKVENLATEYAEKSRFSLCTLWRKGFNHHHKISGIGLDHLCQKNALTLPIDSCYSMKVFPLSITENVLDDFGGTFGRFFLKLSNQVSFARNDNYKYRVECSTDNTNWASFYGFSVFDN